MSNESCLKPFVFINRIVRSWRMWFTMIRYIHLFLQITPRHVICLLSKKLHQNFHWTNYMSCHSFWQKKTGWNLLVFESHNSIAKTMYKVSMLFYKWLSEKGKKCYSRLSIMCTYVLHNCYSNTSVSIPSPILVCELYNWC